MAHVATECDKRQADSCGKKDIFDLLYRRKMTLRNTIYILAIGLLAVVACSRENVRQHVTKPTDSLYTKRTY